jgi:hypothetical protein
MHLRCYNFHCILLNLSCRFCRLMVSFRYFVCHLDELFCECQSSLKVRVTYPNYVLQWVGLAVCICSASIGGYHTIQWCTLFIVYLALLSLNWSFNVDVHMLGWEGFFFRKGAVPASASIDAYGRFYYFIKEFYNVIQIMDHKGSPHKSARQK